MAGDTATAIALLAEALEVRPESLNADAAIGLVEAWDSLAHMRLVQIIERTVGRQLEPEAIVAIGAVADIAAILEQHSLGA